MAENILNQIGALLDQKATAQLLGVDTRTLEHWRLHRRGPRFIRISRRCVRYLPADVMEFLNSKIVETSGESQSTGEQRIGVQ